MPAGRRRRSRRGALVRAFIALGGLLVVALLAALIAPFFIDWTAYRSDFEREASAILGRNVVVHGAANARLLPFPSVTFDDVTVESDDGRPLMTVQQFRMDAELAPYLSGEIRIFSMQLRKPALRVPVARDGAIAWAVQRPNIPVAGTVVLENIAITDGSILIESGVSGQTHQLTGIEATFSARSLQGPFNGSGTLVADGRPLGFTLGSGAREPDGKLPLKLTLDSKALNASLVFDGGATVVDRLPQISGSVSFISPAEQPAASTGETVTPPPASVLPPVKMTGSLVATAKAIDVTDMRVVVGKADVPYTLNGIGTIDLGTTAHFTLQLQGEQVDVDSIATGRAEPHQPVTFAERMRAVREIFAAVPRPPLPGVALLTLPVIVAGDTTIRDVAFAASPMDAGWSIDSFSAELPGRTRLEASGVLALDQTFGFKGNLLLASRQPSGFSDWLTGAVDPSIRTLNGAGFSADVDLDAERQVLDRLEVDVGGDVLTGRLERRRTGEAGEITADLSGKRIDLDSFLALAGIFTGDAQPLTRADHLDLKLKAGPVLYRGATADAIDASLTYAGDTLDVGHLRVDKLAGADLDMSGRLEGLPEAPSGHLTIELDADEPARLVSFLQQRFPGSRMLAALRDRADSLSPLKLSGDIETVDADTEQAKGATARLSGTAAGTQLSLDFDAHGRLLASSGAEGAFDLSATLKNPESYVLLQQLGLPTLPIETASPLAVSLSLSGPRSGTARGKLVAEAPGSRIEVDGGLDLDAGGLDGADLAISARSEDAAPWLLATGVAYGGKGLDALPLDVAGRLQWTPQGAALRGLAGTIDGVRIGAELQRSGDAPVTGSASVASLSLPWLAALVYGASPLDASGSSAWSKAAFAAPLLPQTPFLVDVTADVLDLDDGTRLTGVTGRIAGSATDLQVTDLTAAYAGGTLSGAAALRNIAGLGGFSLTLDANGIAMPQLLPPPADAQGIDGSLSGRISLEGTGQSFAAMTTAVSGAGDVTLTGASVPGIAAGKLQGILDAADAEGFKATQDNTDALVADLDRAARFPLGTVRTDFTVNGGIARFAPVTLKQGGDTLTAALSLDLADLRLAGDVALKLDPGDEAVEGGEPVINYSLAGPVSAPVLTRDTRPLSGYLAVRALDKEQQRVEAMQEALQEKLRLRREARLYRWREAEQVKARAAQEAAEAAERLRLERQQEDAAQRQGEAEAEAAAREAESPTRAQDQGQQPRDAQDRRSRQPQQSPASGPRSLSFDQPVPKDNNRTPSPDFGLPGVEPPLRF
ncbi:AsmA family protein [Aurantimonas sp. MSK8Z-1]|uniref:AsmA family protein n=1 Tax=Mangrovibrevibacter kandeliae TaxID=2968473 RepID=UPI002118BAFE|nr:AsmA family protein [Aurantimonas sp. MSK8Z-1]MCW4116748.1 AsmA family protein [Aurantimonas sp. MSK8Z-1]